MLRTRSCKAYGTALRNRTPDCQKFGQAWTADAISERIKWVLAHGTRHEAPTQRRLAYADIVDTGKARPGGDRGSVRLGTERRALETV